MADMDNFGDIQESFNYITEALDSIRAQNAMNLGNMDKVLVNINNQLEELTKESSSDLMKVFLIELKRNLEEKHDFVSSKFNEMENSFHSIIQKTQKQLTGSEIRELFEIIANNLSTFSKDFTSQKQIISELGLKIEDLQNDDSTKKEILKNISVLKLETEKFGNGFESIIINLNDNFKDLSQELKKLETTDILDGIKKDIENIFLSSNAILSTQQVIDHKNRELEAIINTFVTKDDFNVEREQVAKLIAQNIELTNYINNLPTHNQFESLTEKIDTSIGIINALKNMLDETGKQNQKMLTAQLDNLETKILNISSEEEFIGFRKELSEFAKQVMDNTNLIRADLADTNYAVKSLYDFLNTIDIKNSFLNFTQITKNSENNIKDSVSDLTKNVMEESVKNRNLTRSDVENGVSKISSEVEKAKNEITETSKMNLSSIIEHVQSVVNNIFSVKNALHIENSENMEVIDEKLQVLKEEVVNTSNFVVQNNQENFENILSNIETLFKEISEVKGNLGVSLSENIQNFGTGFQEIEQKIEDTRNSINNYSREGFAHIKNIINEFYEKINEVKEDIETDTIENSTEIKEIIGGLSLKLNTIQETMTTGYDVNFSEVKNSIEELIQITQSAKASLEQSSKYEILNLKTNIEELSQKLSIVEENIDIRSQSNVSQIAALFVELTKDFNNYKEFLSEASQSNFESVSLCVQNLNQKIEESKTLFDNELKSSFSNIHETMASLPDRIKENQVVFENEKKILIEENSRNIQEINEKVQNLIQSILSKDTPFREEVLFEFSGLKSNLEILKEELLRSDNKIDENLSYQISEFITGIENLINQYNEKTNSILISLQGGITEYLESVKQITIQSNSKLDNSINEVLQIKTEIKTIMERISELNEDSSIVDISYDISQKFDSILIEFTRFEEKISAENIDSLQNLLDNIVEKFDYTSSELREVENYTSGKTSEIIEDLSEKAEIIKAQLNLVGTDIINILSSRTSEILSNLTVVSEKMDQLCEFNFEENFVDIKNKLETGYFTITSVIKQDIERLNEEQLENIDKDFETINEKLDKIIYRVSSDNTKQIVELKSILTEKVDNITSINNVLEVVLNRLEEITTYSNSHTESIHELKTEFAERLNILEDSLAQAQDESRSQFFGKIADFQNRKTEQIFDKIDESKEETQRALYEIKENMKNSSEDVYSSAQEVFSDVKSEIVDKINTFEDTILQTHYSTRTAVLEKMSEIQDRSKSELLVSVKENITSTVEELYSSTQEVFEEVKTDLINKINYLEEKFLASENDNIESVIEKINDSQNQTKNELLYGLKENISTVTDELYSSTQAVLSGVKNDLLNKLNDLEEGLIQSQDESQKTFIEKFEQSNSKTKNALLAKIADIHDDISAMKDSTGANLLYEIKENITNSVDDFYSSAQQLFAGLKEDLIEEIVSMKDLVIEGQDETQNTITDKIDEAKYEVKEAILEKISDIQYEISDSQEKTKNDILYGVKENLGIATDDFCNSAQESFAGIKGDILDKVSAIEEELSQSQDEFRTTVLDKIVATSDEITTEIVDNIIQSQEEIKKSIEEEISKSQNKTETVILGELEENIALVKEILDSFKEKEKISEEDTQKLEELQSIVQKVSEDIENKIEKSEETYKTSTQSLLSDIKLSFYEKVDDSLDGLKSFIEVLDQEKENSGLLEEAKAEILDKFLEIADNLEESISSVSVKTELEELNKEIEVSIDDLFEKIKEELALSINGSEALKEISDKSISIEEQIENLKNTVLEDLSDKFAKFEVETANQKSENSTMIEDLKNSLTELKENYIDLSLNSSMEISEILVGFQEKIDNIQNKLEEINQKEIEIDVNSELNNFDFNSAISESKNEITEKISEISQKLDSLISESEAESEEEESETENISINAEVEENIKEIKEILNSQGSLIEKIDNLSNLNDIGDLSALGDLSGIRTEIQNALKNFEEKLEALINENPQAESKSIDSSNINEQLISFKEELIEGLVDFFNQISFTAESEDIKDYVNKKTIEIRTEINSKLGIQNEIKEIKRHLLSLQTALEEDSDYSYTLQDVESDIAKLRLVLKEIAENRNVSIGSSNINLMDLDRISEDITSISTRTNKLLLNSDESYSALKNNLEDLRKIIYQFESKVQYLDNKEPISKIEKKLENINSLMLSSVQTDKIFNQTFVYLAEWIDKADDNINYIRQNMVKTTDVEKLLDKFSKKFDKQEEKIKSLEIKIEKLTKTKPSKETDVKTLVKEVLSKIEMPEFRPDAKLAKKVDGIDKQLVTLGKNIEKITSYVD